MSTCEDYILSSLFVSQSLLPKPICRSTASISTTNDFALYYQNVGGMRGKANHFFTSSAANDFDIIALTKTWSTCYHLTSEFFNSSYDVFRRDRILVPPMTRGGGLMLAVRSNFQSREISLREQDDCIEQICVAVTFGKQSTDVNEIVFILSYIPPSSSFEIYSKHINNIIFIVNSLSYHQTPCVLGDFNIGDVCWKYNSNEKSLIPLNIKTNIETLICDSLYDLNMFQINFILNGINRILDLIFIRNDFIFEICKSDLLLLNESVHHKALLMKFTFYNYIQFSADKQILSYNFKKANYTALNSYFYSIDWQSALYPNSNSLENMYNIFKNILNNAFEQYVPIKKQFNSSKLPWYNKRLINLKNIRNKAHKHFKKTNLDEDKKIFELRRKEFDFLSNFLYKNYINSIESTIKQNAKSFWIYFNMKRKTPSLPNRMEYHSNVAENDQEICDLFADYFGSVFVKNIPQNYSGQFDDIEQVVNIGNIFLEEADVFESILQLDSNKGAGFDLLPPLFLKNCAGSLSVALTYIFNKSLSSGIFLDEWKFAFIVPIFKSGKKSLIENYRPIVKLSTIPKLLDKIVNQKLLNSVKPFISPLQHGFFPGRSTSTNLSLFTNFCIESVENRSQVDVLYTDFIKAFDTIIHKFLIIKLNKLGIHSSLILWLESYLSCRKLLIKVNNFCSKQIDATSGVPQGSHLGPLLFILFINDISNYFNFAHCLLYADDLKLYATIKTEQDCQNFQNDIFALTSWCNLNCLFLNFSKCKILTFSRTHFPIVFNYMATSLITFQRVQSAKDLGVHFDSKLTFIEHRETIISKANSMLGFLKRNSKDFLDPYTLKTLFASLVRSNLEYVSFIWDSPCEIHKNRLERVQKSFTKFALRRLYSYENMPPYVVRCQLLNLSTLVKRRADNGVLFIKDILDNKIDCPELLSKVLFYAPSRDLRVRNIFYNAYHRTNYGLNEPMNEPRCLTTCNIVTVHIDFLILVAIFLKKLYVILNKFL